MKAKGYVQHVRANKEDMVLTIKLNEESNKQGKEGQVTTATKCSKLSSECKQGKVVCICNRLFKTRRQI